ncbi:helix-turn-helix domain-containing protein [Pseudalkalibacillus berkeleyi]|uniref:Helix-turn-helix domain-containing protein n=1 Tax=Pseudalkalibacillus berkeleyi TaxID=1069813 RepID=A0ABS9GX73_9BACL|nr:helix-turn-helix transcriptional regulator [Pseudalkalibacillus berkeleyi]MCF6137289.1 helix-turn-helix domain-containing protein [Pseudalkalibacillus berkeleyi]
MRKFKVIKGTAFELGTKFKESRQEQNISVLELAKKAEVTPSFIVNLENGRIKEPSIGKLIKIAQLLNIEILEEHKDP